MRIYLLPFCGRSKILTLFLTGTLNKIWSSHKIQLDPGRPSGLSGADSIYGELKWNGIQSLATVSVWSLLGCAVLTNRINFIDRRLTLIFTSMLLAILLLVTAIVFPYCFHQDGHPVLIVLYAVIQFFFSFGPNTLLFIIPAEIFP